MSNLRWYVRTAAGGIDLYETKEQAKKVVDSEFVKAIHNAKGQTQVKSLEYGELIPHHMPRWFTYAPAPLGLNVERYWTVKGAKDE